MLQNQNNKKDSNLQKLFGVKARRDNEIKFIIPEIVKVSINKKPNRNFDNGSKKYSTNPISRDLTQMDFNRSQNISIDNRIKNLKLKVQIS